MSQAAQYQAAMRGAIPQVAPVFWSFRIMVGCGSLLLLVLLIALVQTLRGQNRPASLGAENGALEFAVAVDCD
ncbi:cytochrome bd-II oxidase subunit I [Escherichia coli]|uniref:Cytochrome bd-II oxidase subunit I n=1 Tax=Escherichia coli TaxID=562 RepID=A0A376UD00_ECOLX|nr:cytochrome bd-II oxidase subunit I [Escherichia coli]